MTARTAAWTRDEMAERAASLLHDGECVNLGIGIPTLVASHLRGRPILLHTENGLLGVGDHASPDAEDPDVVNAGKEPVTALPGASYFDSSVSFAMIRGGHIDVAVLGAMQVSATGDLANWSAGRETIRGIGGAMDLGSGARRVIAVMAHRDKFGRLKLVQRCDLPLSAVGSVSTVVTDVGVFDIRGGRFKVRELAAGFVPDDEIERLID